MYQRAPFEAVILESVCKDGWTEVNNAELITEAISTVNPYYVAYRKSWCCQYPRGGAETTNHIQAKRSAGRASNKKSRYFHIENTSQQA